ncbi:MAG: hypothetical protein V1853_00915 [bacterium]
MEFIRIIMNIRPNITKAILRVLAVSILISLYYFDIIKNQNIWIALILPTSVLIIVYIVIEKVIEEND